MRRERENTAAAFCVWVSYLGKFHSSCLMWDTLLRIRGGMGRVMSPRVSESCIERMQMNR